MKRTQRQKRGKGEKNNSSEGSCFDTHLTEASVSQNDEAKAETRCVLDAGDFVSVK